MCSVQTHEFTHGAAEGALLARQAGGAALVAAGWEHLSLHAARTDIGWIAILWLQPLFLGAGGRVQRKQSLLANAAFLGSRADHSTHTENKDATCIKQCRHTSFKAQHTPAAAFSALF